MIINNAESPIVDPKGTPLHVRWGTTLLVLLLGALYLPVLVSVLVDCWNDENYSHGVLIPLLVVVLLYMRRDVQPLASRNAERFWRVLSFLAFAAGLGLIIVGAAAAEQFSTRISAIFLLFGLTGLLGGSARIKSWAGPLLLLFFMVPLPYTVFYRLAFPLQLLSTKIAAGSLDLAGFEVSRWGNIFEVNGTKLEVVRACSGIRSMMTLAALAAAASVAMGRSLWQTVVLVLLSSPVAMFGNAIRLIGTALLVVQFGPSAAKGLVHDSVGLLSFMISLGVLVYVWKFITKLGGAESSEAHNGIEADTRAYLDFSDWKSIIRFPEFKSQPLWLCAVVIGLVGSYGAFLKTHTPVIRDQASLKDFPMQFVGLQGEDLEMQQKVLEKVGVDDYLFRTYQAPWGPNIGLYVGYYTSQREGSQIHSPQHCYPGAGFDIEEVEVLRVRTPAGKLEELRRLIVERDGQRDIVIYWYDTRTGRLSSDWRLKLNLMQTALRNLPQDAAFVRWSTPIAEEEDVEQATIRLLRVAAAALPHLGKALPFEDS